MRAHASPPLVLYLLDTNVFRLVQNPKAPDRAHENALAWLDGRDDDEIRLSAATLREVSRGIDHLAKTKPDVAAAMRSKLGEVRDHYSGRIVTVDEEIAEEWGRLESEKAGSKKPKGDDDMAFVSTARVRGLVLVTRNVKDVRGLGVRVLNPFVKPWRVVTV